MDPLVSCQCQQALFSHSVAIGERMRAIRRRPDESTVIGLGVLGNWVLRSTTHLALQSTILSFLYLEDSPKTGACKSLAKPVRAFIS